MFRFGLKKGDSCLFQGATSRIFWGCAICHRVQMPHCHGVIVEIRTPPHPALPGHLPLKGKAFAKVLCRTIGFPSRGSCRRQPTDEVASFLCHNAAAVLCALPCRVTTALWQRFVPHLIRPYRATFPSKGRLLPRHSTIKKPSIIRSMALVRVARVELTAS